MANNPYAAVALHDEPKWPNQSGPYLVLIESSGPLERRLLRGWIERNKPADAHAGDVQIAYLPQTRRRRRRRKLDRRIEAFFHTGEDPLLIPLRVSWLPSERDGRRTVGWRDLLSLGDPRDPDPIRQYAIYRMRPDRCRIVGGDPVRASAIRDAWEHPSNRGRTDGHSLSEFAALRSWIRLERAERRLRGSRSGGRIGRRRGRSRRRAHARAHRVDGGRHTDGRLGTGRRCCGGRRCRISRGLCRGCGSGTRRRGCAGRRSPARRALRPRLRRGPRSRRAGRRSGRSAGRSIQAGDQILERLQIGESRQLDRHRLEQDQS